MGFELLALQPEDLQSFKDDMREAFQIGAESEFPDLDVEILQGEDIDRSLSKTGAAAYKAVVDGKMVGGAIVVIDESTKHNHLDFLYVKQGTHSRGIGQLIWHAIEEKYPDTKVWKTFTPYFEKRNIHFYMNRCGFAAVEFLNPHHKDPNIPGNMIGGDYFFSFEKRMK